MTRNISTREHIFFGILIGIIADKKHADHDLYPLFMIASLGMRPSELIGLTWDRLNQISVKNKATMAITQELDKHDEEIEGVSGYYIKDTTKNHTERIIPLPEPWRKALVEQKKKRIEATGGEWSKNMVFLKPNGHHWTRQGLNKEWHRILTDYTEGNKTPAIADWRPYYIRHMAISLMNRVATQKTTADLMGHSEKIDATVYEHAMREDYLNAMTSYDSLIVEKYLKEEREEMKKDAERGEH